MFLCIINYLFTFPIKEVNPSLAICLILMQL